MKSLIILVLLGSPFLLKAQTVPVLLQEGANAEKQFNDVRALQYYQQALQMDTSNTSILVKCAELNCRIGDATADPAARASYFGTAKNLADKALLAGPGTAEANFAMAMVMGKLASVEKENRILVAEVNQVYLFAKKALAIDPDFAKAAFILGKWHYQILSLPWFKKAALRTFYRGLPPANMDSAVFYLEKCRRLDSYFLPAYLTLAQAYQYQNLPRQEIDVLNRLVRMPNRNAEDVTVKAEGQKLLSSLE